MKRNPSVDAEQVVGAYITHVATLAGWVYAAFVIDAYARQVRRPSGIPFETHSDIFARTRKRPGLPGVTHGRGLGLGLVEL